MSIESVQQVDTLPKQPVQLFANRRFIVGLNLLIAGYALALFGSALLLDILYGINPELTLVIGGGLALGVALLYELLGRYWPLAIRISLAGAIWLVLSLFFLTVAWLRSMNLLMLLSYQMLLLWGLNMILAGRRLHRLEARRRISGPVFAGIPCQQEIELTNRDDRQQLGLHLVERGPAHEQAGFVARLGPGECAAFTSELVLPRRGRYQGEPLRVESGYPFGLLKRRAVLGNRLDVIVLPRLGQVHRGRLRRFLQHAAPAAGGLRARARPQPLVATEFHGLRPFHSGDSLSWIHWRTSARRGELMVREFEEATSDNLVLAVDPWLPEARPDPRAELLLEEAISLAATICWEWCRQTDDRLTLLLAGSSPVILHGSTGREHALRLLECLALEPGTARPGWDTLLDRLTPGTLPAGPVLLVSTRGDDPGHDLASVVRRPIARLNIDEVARHDFYERPGHAS